MAKKETKTNKKENNKNKRSFWKDFKAELKKVVWPTPKQLVNNTVAVVTIVLITAAIVFVLDLAFEAVNTFGVDKVKEIVGTSADTTEEISDDAENISTEEITSEETETNVEESNVEETNEQTSTETEQNVENNAENNAE